MPESEEGEEESDDASFDDEGKDESSAGEDGEEDMEDDISDTSTRTLSAVFELCDLATTSALWRDLPSSSFLSSLTRDSSVCTDDSRLSAVLAQELDSDAVLPSPNSAK
jgi:hypothetical protein